MGITHRNHYVPQASLRRWSLDGGERVYAYRTLVSEAIVPEWELKAIRGLASQPDLYTSVDGGQETDEFERWIGREYEDPGLKAIDKVVSNKRLTPTDWDFIARFVAAQDLRTPANFLELQKLWDSQAPAILDGCIESFKKLQRGERSVPLNTKGRDPTMDSAIRVRVSPGDDPLTNKATVEVEIAPRKLWLCQVRDLLTRKAASLSKHRWSVATPDGDEEWPLTDHPVIRLNYYKSGNYDFLGGWDRKGSEILIPVSPKHLLCVQVGKKLPNRFVAPNEVTKKLQRIIVERCHRWIFARRPDSWISEVRPRVVDREAFHAEQESWSCWSEQQRRVETEMPEDSPAPSITS
ncbi:MAG TPA: DUF4238 domain-containing protein [Candidatus Solibacter sp.]|nr:DUF4238 domain-containing protein [Candidatus Solibacter sp.]